MSNSVGNVIYAPGSGSTPFTTDAELLASGKNWRQYGGTLKQGAGVIPVGAPMAYDSGTGTYVQAAANATTGVVGFNRYETDSGVANTDIPRMCLIVDRGTLRYSLIKAANSATDLTSGTLTALGARIDTVRDELTF